MPIKTIDPDDILLGIAPAPVPAKVEDEVLPNYGPAFAACSVKERTFVLTRLMPDVSDPQAARLAGYGHGDSSSNTMARIAFRLTHENPRVAAAVAEVAKIAVRDLAIDALKTLKTIVRQPFHKDAGKIALAIIERVDPTVQRQDINVRHEVVDRDAEGVQALRAFKASGATREFLEDWFGYGGLLKYEKMLAAADKANPITVDYTEVTDGDSNG